ncbi:hypothetical protein HYPSUDRAFT_202572 [Hypholoma sublateritium FD-334 SS-4]|uniref:Uncharacterized protein n=1 Tax=Hypholoma sublateritium (strain FD-334 SS-4) TaxID=945553 RepID=A0A0D2NZG8_HYPSF|nr:hypothetical protein HYPSUDRAFT_202572 [Hypholoma sublateritium FD-334 SS-4]
MRRATDLSTPPRNAPRDGSVDTAPLAPRRWGPSKPAALARRLNWRHTPPVSTPPRWPLAAGALLMFVQTSAHPRSAHQTGPSRDDTIRSPLRWHGA